MSTQRKVPSLECLVGTLFFPLNSLIKTIVRYLDTDENILSLEALKNMYQLFATNLELDSCTQCKVKRGCLSFA